MLSERSRRPVVPKDLRTIAIKLMRRYGIVPSKEMGQHFMTDEEDLRAVAEAANINPQDVVLEIGPGVGFLTQEILAKGPKRLIAIEKDQRLVQVLRRLFEAPNLEILHGDALDSLPTREFSKIVSNPPFSISSRLMLGLLDSSFEIASVTLQEEFAMRLVAEPGSNSYGSLSVLTWLKLHAAVVKRIPRESFLPPPGVDAALVEMRPGEIQLQNEEWNFLKGLLPFLFENRKKKLKNPLTDFLIHSHRLRANEAKSIVAGIVEAENRVYKISASEYLDVARGLIQNLSGTTAMGNRRSTKRRADEVAMGVA